MLIHRHGACTSHACDFLEKDFAEYEYYLPSDTANRTDIKGKFLCTNSTAESGAKTGWQAERERDRAQLQRETKTGCVTKKGNEAG
jgi:hypothetical protein